jgi:hypothetical protein
VIEAWGWGDGATRRCCGSTTECACRWLLSVIIFGCCRRSPCVLCLSLSLALIANSNAFLFRYGRFIFSFWFHSRDLQIIQDFGIPDKGDNNLRETMGKRRTGTNVDGDEEKEEEEESKKAVLEGAVSDEESAVEVKVIGQVLKRSGGKGKVERKHYQAFEVDGCRYDVVSFS